MITTLLEWFAFGGILFWIALGSLTIALIGLSERDRHFTKLFLFSGILVLFVPQLKSLSTSQYVGIGVFYLIIGLIYSLIKWHLNVRDTIDNHKDLLRKYNVQTLNQIDLAIKSIRSQREEYQAKYNHTIRSSDWAKADANAYFDLDRENEIFKNLKNDIAPNENKGKIYNWTLHWPWSILRMLTADLAESLYQLLKSQYVRIVDSALSSNVK